MKVFDLQITSTISKGAQSVQHFEKIFSEQGIVLLELKIFSPNGQCFN